MCSSRRVETDRYGHYYKTPVKDKGSITCLFDIYMWPFRVIARNAALSPSKKINAQEDKRAYTSVEVPAGYTADWVGGRTDLGIVVISVKCLVDGNQANGYRLKIVSRIMERL